MVRFLLFFLLGYIIWTIFRIMQRMNRMRQRGHNRTPSRPGGEPRPREKYPEIRDAEFEDIEPRKDDDT